MIKHESFKLENGLRVVVHEDLQNPMVFFNLLYDVGSKHEEETKTGFAHLFEHLMFGGSVNVKNYDEPLQKAGAENNAFTSPDVTNYYINIPKENLETAFWLESDRMLSLSFDPKVLDVQKSVVVEEFKQRYLNQPYGDVWHHLRELCYEKHNYRWPTIGKEISHIENATMEDVKDFFFSHYAPNNAVLVLAGNINLNEAENLCLKWFGNIPKRELKKINPKKEPQIKHCKEKKVVSEVPFDALYIAFHCSGRFEKNYHTADLISDMLGRGKSSILHQKLVKENNIFNSVNCYCTGSIDTGLMVIEGKVSNGYNIDLAEQKVWEVLEEIIYVGVEETILQKVKNQSISSQMFGEIEMMNRALNLAYYTMFDKTENINQEIEKISSVSKKEVDELATELLNRNQSVCLKYCAKNEN
ncbi:MAG: pitrilysin family protein [Cytophagales bacterium]